MASNRQPLIITKELIDYLDGQFPDKLPTTAKRVEDVALTVSEKIGSRKVIKHLQHLFNESQNKEAINTVQIN